MKQLTIRGFDEALEKQLRQMAAEENLSLNKALAFATALNLD